MQKMRHLYDLIRINTSFWCGRQKLKTPIYSKNPLFSRLLAFEHHTAHQEIFITKNDNSHHPIDIYPLYLIKNFHYLSRYFEIMLDISKTHAIICVFGEKL